MRKTLRVGCMKTRGSATLIGEICDVPLKSTNNLEREDAIFSLRKVWTNVQRIHLPVWEYTACATSCSVLMLVTVPMLARKLRDHAVHQYMKMTVTFLRFFFV
jgi:hypothetical protein